MSRTETAHRLTVSAVDRRVEDWTEQVRRLQSMEREVSDEMASLTERKAETADEMARALLPIAQSMARLTEETRQTLQRVVTQSQQGHAQAVQSVQSATRAANAATTEIRTAMLRGSAVVDRLEAMARDEQSRPPPNMWGPAILAALVPTAAVAALAWRMGVLFR